MRGATLQTGHRVACPRKCSYAWTFTHPFTESQNFLCMNWSTCACGASAAQISTSWKHQLKWYITTKSRTCMNTVRTRGHVQVIYSTCYQAHVPQNAKAKHACTYLRAQAKHACTARPSERQNLRRRSRAWPGRYAWIYIYERVLRYWHGSIRTTGG
jgi:hypothetical protein